jgi:hypothetical protein
VVEAFFPHHPGVEPIEDVEQLIRIAAEKRAGQDDGARASRSHRAQSIALSRLALQFMNFVGDTVIEESVEVSPDELDRRHPLNLLVIRLPKWTEEGPG